MSFFSVENAANVIGCVLALAFAIVGIVAAFAGATLALWIVQ